MTAEPNLGPDQAQPAMVGWREWVQLPDLDMPPIKAKVDTGARTSCLHAFAVEAVDVNGTAHVRFAVHPRRRHPDPEVCCEAPILDQRLVTDSGGHREMRYVIRSRVILGPYQFTADFTLTNRDDMMFRMLLGREALTNRFTVDPSQSYLLGKKPATARSVQP